MLQFLFSFALFSFFCGGVFACVCRGVVSVNDLKMQYNLHFVGECVVFLRIAFFVCSSDWWTV